MDKDSLVNILSYVDLSLGGILLFFSIIAFLRLPFYVEVFYITRISFFGYLFNFFVSFLLIISGFILAEFQPDKKYEIVGIVSGILGFFVFISGLSELYTPIIEIEPLSSVFLYSLFFVLSAYIILIIDGFLLYYLKHDISFD